MLKKKKKKSRSNKGVESTVSRANEFGVYPDIKGVGKGRSSLRDFYGPKTLSHSPIGVSCDVKEKDFVVL